MKRACQPRKSRPAARRRACGFRLPSRFTVEELESRVVLAAPGSVDVSPEPLANDASQSTDLSAVFDQTLQNNSVTDDSFVVQGMFTGKRLAGGNTFHDVGSTATADLASDQGFFPGELVNASLTSGIQSLGGEPASPFVWQFRAETTSGSGYFEPGLAAVDESVGTAVAVGNLDGDPLGRPDLFIVGLVRNRVFLNVGGGVFQSNTQSLNSVANNDVALADLDNDGDLDAFVAALGPNRVWLNDGSGHFTDSGQLLGNAESNSIALGDLDGNGTIDAFVGNSDANRVWLNDGSGMFNDSEQQLGDFESLSVALGDLDGDGDLDGYVGNSGGDSDQPDTVWRNNGNGVFTDTRQRLGAWSSNAIELVDIDDDADLDAITVGARNQNVVWRNNGGGTFVDTGQRLGPNVGGGVGAADMDGDGDPDLVIGFRSDSSLNPQPNRVLLNDGFGRFEATGQEIGNGFTRDVAIADYDGDGDNDFFSANDSTLFLDGNALWLNNGESEFTATSTTLGFSHTEAIAFGDLDNDGNLDAVVGAVNDGNAVWFGRGDGRFGKSNQFLGDSDTRAIALGDLDGDGDLDAFAGNSANQPNRVWINDGSGVLTDSGQELGVRSTWDVTLGDIDGDGDLDAVTANSGTQANKVWLNNGEGVFNSGPSLGNSDSRGADLADIDSDGDLDLFVANAGQEANLVYRNDGQGNFTTTGQQLGAASSWDVELGDLDGDGDVDAFVANNSNQPNAIWINNGDGMFFESGQSLGARSSRAVRLGDVDGDGDLDAIDVSGVVTVWRNDAGKFEEISQSLGVGAYRAFALGDLDNDGDLDAWLGQEGTADRLLMNFDTTPILFDAFESNDNVATAANIDVASFEQQLMRRVEGLTIHAGDEDWFAWTAPESGPATFDVLFEHAMGDIDVSLHRANGAVLESSNSSDDNERMVHNVVDGDVYLIRIVGRNGLVANRYDLEIQGAEYAPDHLEGVNGNDGLDTATPLGSGSRSFTNLSLHNATNHDWFRLTPNSNVQLVIEATFDAMQGDVELELTDDEGRELAISETIGDREEIEFDVNAGRTYFIHVFGFEDATNPSYNLTIATGNDLPTINVTDEIQLDEDRIASIPFVVQDDATPASQIAVTATSSNSSLAPNGNLSLTGSGSNRVLRVTPLPNAFGTTTITFTVDDGVGGVTERSIELTVNPVNDDPTISAIGNFTIDMDSSTPPIPFVVDDVENTATPLILHAESSDPTLVPIHNIVFGGSGANRTVQITPTAGRIGSSAITILVDDGTTTVPESFILTVFADNTPPTISEIRRREIPEDTSTGLIPFIIGDAETPANQLIVTARTNNTALVPVRNIVLGGSGTNRTVQVTPAANQTGQANITIDVRDANGATHSERFLLDVTPVNDDPLITSPSEVTVANQSTFVMTVAATDVDGDNLSFSTSGGVDQAQFNLDANSGVLSFVNPADVNNPQDANADNVYEVIVRAADQHGGQDTQLIRVTVDSGNVALTADIVDVAPESRAAPVDSIAIVFSHPVTGFDTGDLRLLRHGDQTTVLPLNGAQLTTNDNVTWTLSNLAALTRESGFYELTLVAANSGITNGQGLALSQNADDDWTNGAGDVNFDGQFDQLDIILILQGGKYLTGETATWSEGDWDGNGIFNQLDIIWAQQPSHYLAGPFAASQPQFIVVMDTDDLDDEKKKLRLLTDDQATIGEHSINET